MPYKDKNSPKAIACQRKSALKYYYTHRQKILEQTREKRKANIEEERIYENAYAKQYRAANKEKVNEKNRIRYQKRKNLCKCGNKKTCTANVCIDCRQKQRNRPTQEEWLKRKRLYAKREYDNNPDKVLKRNLKSYEKNKEKILKYHRDLCKRNVAELSNAYIKRRIVMKTDLKSTDIPQELIELYKLKLTAERMVRNDAN